MTADPNPLMTVALDRTADELLRCRDIVLRIEAAVHDLIDGGPPLAPAARADLQAIDLLDQRLADLTTWVQALAAASGETALTRPVGPILNDLRLAELRAALSGAAARQGPRQEAPRNAAFPSLGAAELF